MSPSQLLKKMGGLRSSNNSSSSSKRPAWLQFSERSLPRERMLLQPEMQRLLQLAPQQGPASIVVDHRQQQQHHKNMHNKALVRDPLKQLHTVEQAAAHEAQLGNTASPLLSLEAPNLGLRSGRWQDLQDSSSSSSSGSRRGPLQPLLAQQQLFSVYVHTPDGLLLPPGSIFSGSELRVSLNTTQGYAQHVLAEAAVLLLRAALQDESNVHFVMVSDTSIPLYPPQVVWAQMMSEQRSRLDACMDEPDNLDIYRWSAGLSSDYFGKQHWRKSSQWFTLTRPAALLAVADSHVRELFRRHCYTNFTVLIRRSMCVSDEHYLPSLMASYGLDDATDCKGRVSYADWSPGGWHPKTFAAQEITPELVPQMRGGHQAAGVHPTAALPGHLAAAPVVDAETAVAGAVAGAVGEALARAGAQVAAATAAAAAAALRLQQSAAPDDEGLPCDVAAAMYSASSIFVQPRGDAAAGVGDAASADAAAAATALDVNGVMSDVQYWLGVQMSWLRRKGRQLDSSSSSSSSSRGDEHDAHAAPVQQPGRDSDEYALLRHGAARWMVGAGYVPLASHCPLFARKFTAGVVNETLAMALSCAGLGMGSWCTDQQWLAQPSRTG
ncbi:core-2/I-branching enzyme-domain-containing protein [Scenedesmus sp. NREL 46B-D3]|nr:core-2/I-branching enzyme-domain-containing protein [Scenedesmus sp. NREL 46B-D3]